MDYNANTIVKAKNDYLNIRYNELSSIKISVIEEKIIDNKAILTNYDNNTSSIYILEQYRGQGLYKKIAKNVTKIMTMEDCKIVEYLESNNIDYIIVEPSESYKLIRNYYGDKKAKRSGVKLINHIDEGLKILNNLKVEQMVLDAYCLHPIFQSDDNFNKALTMNLDNIDNKAIMLAVEYRRVANSYLSFMNPNNFVGFTNDYVKQMLYADKIQNEKDFRLYHEGKHGRSKELRKYFNYWINELLN
jgi:hypothetical protein